MEMKVTAVVDDVCDAIAIVLAAVPSSNTPFAVAIAVVPGKNP